MKPGKINKLPKYLKDRYTHLTLFRIIMSFLIIIISGISLNKLMKFNAEKDKLLTEKEISQD